MIGPDENRTKRVRGRFALKLLLVVVVLFLIVAFTFAWRL